MTRHHSNGNSSNKYDPYAIHLTSSVFTGSGTYKVQGTSEISTHLLSYGLNNDSTQVKSIQIVHLVGG